MHRMPDDMIARFFAMFSRYEYALKEAGRFKPPTSDDDTAWANWDEVEKALRGLDMADSGRVKARAGILLTDPPRKQVIANQKLDWRTPGPAGDWASSLVKSIKRVRNNLFHGGKYSPTGEYLSNRSAELVQCAQAVLEELLVLPALSDVAETFHGYRPEEQ